MVRSKAHSWFLRPCPALSSWAALSLSLVTALACLQAAGPNLVAAADESSALVKLQQLEETGNFHDADALSASMEADASLTATERRQFEFERERLRRIRRDYTLSEEELAAAVRAAVRDLAENELAAWIRQGRFDSRRIDGATRYLKVSVSNLFFRHPELEPRRLRPRNPGLARALWTNAMAIRSAARAAGQPFVLPRQFAAHLMVRVQPAAWSGAREPVTARAWLPVPRQLPFQDNLHIVRSEPSRHTLAPPESLIRSIYFERILPPQSTNVIEFRADYEYRAHGVWFDVVPSKSQWVCPCDTDLSPFLAEEPHIEFSPAMKTLSQGLAGNETNVVNLARRFYDWVADNIRYSFAPEYSTIRNLGEFCRSRSYGDCGMETFLFMTLCRMNGIPARWQSGWSIFPGAETMHDWCEVYLAPWGWVPVDPYMGIYARQYATALNTSQRQELSEFYFGGLDQYRMTANGGHNQLLAPAKSSFRSDDVDFQRGEVEVNGRNVYFDHFDYDFGFSILDAESEKRRD